MPADHEVAIVGGGPVGLLLACLVARAGLEVAVFERRAAPVRTSRAIGILPPGVRALESAGLGAALRAGSLHVTRGVAASGARVLAEIPLDGPEVRTIPQPDLERLLRARLAELAPGSLHAGMEVEGVLDRGDRVTWCAGADEHSARWLIAADGVRSAIRARLGIAWRGRDAGPRYLMADVAESTDLGAAALLDIGPEGVVESFPLPGGRRRWVARVSAGTPADGPTLGAIVRARTGHAPVIGAEVSAFVARQHRAAALRAGRIALVGDAAHEVSPIGGQGMSLGWMGAVRLAAELAAGDPDLGRYERAQLRSVRAAQRRARFNMSMGAPIPVPARVLRDAAALALGSRALRGVALRAFTMSGA